MTPKKIQCSRCKNFFVSAASEVIVCPFCKHTNRQEVSTSRNSGDESILAGIVTGAAIGAAMSGGDFDSGSSSSSDDYSGGGGDFGGGGSSGSFGD